MTVSSSFEMDRLPTASWGTEPAKFLYKDFFEYAIKEMKTRGPLVRRLEEHASHSGGADLQDPTGARGSPRQL
jgi:hypothetical protein